VRRGLLLRERLTLLNFLYAGARKKIIGRILCGLLNYRLKECSGANIEQEQRVLKNFFGKKKAASELPSC
jgi:hypothetical protein